MKGPMPAGPKLFPSKTPAEFFGVKEDESMQLCTDLSLCHTTSPPKTTPLHRALDGGSVIVKAAGPSAPPATAEAPAPSAPSPTTAMAYQLADAQPFLPPGFNRIAIEGRDVMVRSVLNRPLARHEDFAIVTYKPLPDDQVPFPMIRAIIWDFLENHVRVRIANIQPSSLGQALVKFEYMFDRDRMVNTSPHVFNGRHFNFVKHNEGRNHKALEFNQECWLMPFGFPLDYWNFSSIQSAIGAFGRVLAWEDDQNNLVRLIIRARVIDLERVPQFILVTDAEGFHGNSWIVQCEVIEQQLLGALPTDEEPVPQQVDAIYPFFDFMGFGQPAQPHAFLEGDNQEHNEDNGNHANDADAMQWGLWSPQVVQVLEPAQLIALPQGDAQAAEEEDADSDISSVHSDQGIPDLNANIIYEVVMAENENDNAVAPQPAEAHENAEQDNVFLALAAPQQLQVPHFNLNHEPFLLEEIQVDELMDDAAMNMEVMMEEADDLQPVQAEPIQGIGTMPEEGNQDGEYREQLFVGCMEIVPFVDPVIGETSHATYKSYHPDLYRKWAAHFQSFDKSELVVTKNLG